MGGEGKKERERREERKKCFCPLVPPMFTFGGRGVFGGQNLPPGVA